MSQEKMKWSLESIIKKKVKRGVLPFKIDEKSKDYWTGIALSSALYIA